MIARRIRLIPLVILTVVWIMLWGSLSWWNVIGGVLVAVLVLVLFPLPIISSGIRVHPLRLLVVIGQFLTDLALASFQVAWKAVRPRGVAQGAVLTVRLTETDPLRRTIVAELTSLVPGTIVIDLNPDTGDMLMHVLDHCEPERLERERRSVRELERRVRWALGSDSAGARRSADEVTR